MNDMTTTAAANPFGSSAPAPRAATAVAHTDSQRAVAEVQAAMMIARMNPRDPVAAMDRILNACSRPTLANAAVYTYSRGGQDVSGPSIRLAEAMAQQWGNIKTSVRELDQSHGTSTVQAIAWDLETGYQCDKVFHVPHIRYTKNGTKKLEDPRDVYELVANQGARRLRACILAVIPGDVTEAAVAQCETTMHASADTSADAMKKMVDAFGQYGVTREQIEKRIQRRLDAIQPAQVVQLKKVYASLRDGMSSPADWFEGADSPTFEKPSASADAVKEALKGGRPAAKTAAPKPPATPAQQRPDQVFDVARFEQSLKACNDHATLLLMLDELRDLPEGPDRDRLTAVGNAREVEMSQQRRA